MEVYWNVTCAKSLSYQKNKNKKKNQQQLIRHGREEGRVVLLLLIPSHKIFGFLSEKELMFAK